MKCIWPETWIFFLALNNIHFLWVFRKSLRNIVPPTILSSTLVFAVISPTLLTLVPTLAHHPPYPRWRTTHVSHASTPPTLARHPHHPGYPANHALMPATSPMLAHHPRKQAAHDTYSSTWPTQARYLHHPR